MAEHPDSQHEVVSKRVARAGRITITSLDILLTVAYAIGAVALAWGSTADSTGKIANFPGHPDRAIFFWVGIAATGLAAVGVVRVQLRNRKLEGQNAFLAANEENLTTKSRRATELVNDLMKAQLALMLQEQTFASNERLSLFVARGDAFSLVARHSLNPTFCTAARDTGYPLDQGCIGAAWANQTAAVDDLPNPRVDEEAWQRRLLQDWSIPEDVSGSMKMKSRTCVAHRIDGPLGGDARGVVVFESIDVPATPTASSTGRPELTPSRIDEYVSKHREVFERLFDLAAELRE